MCKGCVLCWRVSASEGEINLCRRGSTSFPRYTSRVTDGAEELQANMEMKRIRTGSNMAVQRAFSHSR